MSLQALVLDASALLDAADADVEGADEALIGLRERAPAMAPSNLASELGNVIHRKRPRAFGASPRERVERLELLLEGIALAPSDPGSRASSAALVASLGLTFYDAEYLELAARAPGTLLVTQDAGLLRAARLRIGVAWAVNLREAAERMAAGDL